MVQAGDRQPPQCYPPHQRPPWGWPSHLRPSVKISYAILLVPPIHYLAGYLMQCSLLPISQGGAVISKPYTDHVYASDKSTISDTKTPTYSVPTGP